MSTDAELLEELAAAGLAACFLAGAAALAVVFLIVFLGAIVPRKFSRA